jgi:hypothetical protein
VTKHVPWTRIIAEFIAILAGVTVALLADDWRAYRSDRDSERAALEEILRDLEADSAELVSQRRRMRLQNEAALWAQANFGADVPEDSALIHYSRLFTYALYQPVRSGYLGLRDSGDLTLILDRDLRQGVVHYYEVTQPYMLQFDSRYWPTRDAFVEVATRDVLLVGDTSAKEIFPSGFGYELRRPWREFSRDFEFRNRLMHFGAYASNWGVRIGQVLERNRELRDRVTEYLRR